jgi:hypothetical protein
MRTTNVEQKLAETRERVPVHEARDKFKFRGLDNDNFYYRLVKKNDPERITTFLNAGYRFVTKDGTTHPDSSIKTAESADGTSSLIEIAGGLGVTLVLMALPREFYEQDQKAKQQKVDTLEADVYRDLQQKASPREGNYGKIERFGSEKGKL